MKAAPSLLNAAALALCVLALPPGAAAAQDTSAGDTLWPVLEPKAFTQPQLDELLAPIALYPDALIAQILPAATFPVEVVQAARWTKRHPDLDGLDEQDWDPSVLAIARYPTVLRKMDDDLDWTVRLGEAFLSQQQDVMSSIQRLRAKARDVGSLCDTPQQVVIVDDASICIEPALADVIYVPAYNPRVVYVQPTYPCAPSSFVSFSVGFACGSWLDLGCDWRSRRICHGYDRGSSHHDGDRWGGAWGSWGSWGSWRSGAGWGHERSRGHRERESHDRQWADASDWKRDPRRERPSSDRTRRAPSVDREQPSPVPAGQPADQPVDQTADQPQWNRRQFLKPQNTPDRSSQAGPPRTLVAKEQASKDLPPRPTPPQREPAPGRPVTAEPPRAQPPAPTLPSPKPAAEPTQAGPRHPALRSDPGESRKATNPQGRDSARARAIDRTPPSPPPQAAPKPAPAAPKPAQRDEDAKRQTQTAPNTRRRG